MSYKSMMWAGCCCLAILAAGHPARATEAGQNPAGDTEGDAVQSPRTPAGGIEEIVVYAERRAAGAGLQSVPMSITAVDEATMEAANVQDLTDIGRLVPNAQLEAAGTFPGYANFYIRGVGVSSTVRSIDPAINVIQDGMVISYQAGAVLDTFDLESVEVLRGPQGVLFGRNATGGAIVLRSRRPTHEFEGRAQVTIGNGDTFDTHSAIGGSIIPDVLAARISLSTRYSNGLYENVTDGIFIPVPSNPNPTGEPVPHRTGGLPKVREVVVKPSFAFTFGPDTRLTLLTQYQNYDDGGGVSWAFLPEDPRPTNLQTQWGYFPTTGKYQTNLSEEGYTDIEAYHLIAEFEQDFGSAGTLIVTAAHRNIDYDSTLTSSGDPYTLTLFPDNRENNKQYSLEARYNVVVSDSIELLLGGFYLETTTDVEEYRITRSGTSVDRNYSANIWNQDVRSYAIFGNIDWRPVPELTLSAGLRYSNDRKALDIIPLGSCVGQSFQDCPTDSLTAVMSWDDLSPRLVANYRPTNDLTFYASYAKGYRAGNFNARTNIPAAAATPANPETVGAYELGAKMRFFDRRLRLNLAAFQEDYSDIQRVVVGTGQGQTVQSLFNAASATIRGLEAEISVLPFTGFRIDSAIGYTDAQYNSFVGLTGLPAGVDPTDLEFDRVPKWTAHVAASYTVPLGPGDFSGRASYTYRSHVFTTVNNEPGLEQDGFGIIDASLAYESGPWLFRTFVHNLANTFYADNKVRGASYQAYGGSPRRYGLTVGYMF